MMTRRMGVLLLLAAVACRPLNRTERQDLETWLLCEECTGGERERVARLGDRAVNTLAGTLGNGPAADRRANMAQQIRELYGRLGGAAAVGATEAAFVSRYLDNYVVTYRVRSAMSLGDIGTPKALRALQRAATGDSAGTSPLPPAVRLAVMSGLAEGLPAFSGTLNDSSVRAFDTVNVRRGSVAWDGDEVAVIRGAPFADLVVGRGPDSVRVLAVALPGSYNLTIENEGQGPVRVPFRIHSLRYEPRTPATSPDLGLSPFPMRFFLALAPPPAADTIDYFRFTAPPAGDLTITATATWSGNQDVDLGWRSCVGAGVGGTDGVTAAKPEKTTFSIPAGTCWLLTISGRGSATPALVQLDLVRP